MSIKWLATTAIALVIGSGAVFAQSQTDLPQKRDEGHRAQTPSLPSKEADRPAAGEQRATDRLKDRTAQPDAKSGAKEPQRGETPSERKQAQEPSSRDAKQPARESQEQPGRGERPPASRAQQDQDRQKGEARQKGQAQQKEDAKSRDETKQGREGQSKQDQARDAKQPAEPKQQQGQQQPSQQQPSQQQPNQQQSGQQQPGQQQPGQQQSGQPGREQAAQPSTAPAQQGQSSGQPADQATKSGTGRDSNQAQQSRAQDRGNSSVTVNEQQRTQIIDRLRRDRTTSTQNVNIQVNIGERLPPRVRPRPLPPDIVRIAPQYRSYEYTVIEDQVVIVNPRTREVVDVVREPGPGVASARRQGERILITSEQRESFKQVARRMTTAPVAGSPSGGSPDSSCLTLQPVPEELVRTNPELGSYRYLAIGDQVVLVDPRQQKIVEVID
jgi:hypothetical protein